MSHLTRHVWDKVF